MKAFRLIALPLFLLVGLAACNNGRDYVIEGTLYGGRNFEGRTIYLVPFSGAGADNIDSAIVHESRFHFDGTVQQDAVYTLHMNKVMSVFIDDLIIILEPGRIRTKLSQPSSAKGTPLNDSLQSWREFKAKNDSALRAVSKELMRARSAECRAALQDKQDSLRASFETRTRASIKQNNNAFGEFLGKVLR